MFKVRRHSSTAQLPSRAYPLSAGYDLASGEPEPVTVKAGRYRLVSTGLTMQIPEGHYGRIAARSGLAVRHGIDVGAGVIDADYTGIVSVLLFNHGDADVTVSPGDRIAQLLLERVSTPDVEEDVDLFSTCSTERGTKGFGSSGIQ